jgi:hypothetical protein
MPEMADVVCTGGLLSAGINRGPTIKSQRTDGNFNPSLLIVLPLGNDNDGANESLFYRFDLQIRETGVSIQALLFSKMGKKTATQALERQIPLEIRNLLGALGQDAVVAYLLHSP